MAQALAEKLEHPEPAKRKRVASVPKKSSRQVRHTRFCQEERNRAVCPEHQIVKKAFSVSIVKRAPAEERKRDEYSSEEVQ